MLNISLFSVQGRKSRRSSEALRKCTYVNPSTSYLNEAPGAEPDSSTSVHSDRSCCTSSSSSFSRDTCNSINETNSALVLLKRKRRVDLPQFKYESIPSPSEIIPVAQLAAQSHWIGVTPKRIRFQ